MKNTKFLLLLLVASFTLGLTSCKKDEEIPPTKSEIIVDGVWTYAKSEIYINGELDEIYTPEVDEVITFDFKSDHTLIINSDGEITNIDWEINADGDVLFLYDEDENDEAEMYKIERLDDNNFDFSIEGEILDDTYKQKTYLTR